MTIEIRATGDPWDAPLVACEYPDGTSFLARELDTEPPGWIRSTVLPHAQVWVNGVMSGFDAGRQPEDPEAERFRLAIETWATEPTVPVLVDGVQIGEAVIRRDP